MGSWSLYAYGFGTGSTDDCTKGIGTKNQKVSNGVYAMINAIIEAISISLNAEFGDRYKIYQEIKQQGLQEPCFFIQCLNPTNKLFLNKRYFRTNQFCVQYFPEQEGQKKKECYAIAERLFQCLEWLEVKEDLMMGTQMRYELVDGIIHFFVNYDAFVYKIAESSPFMEEVYSETSAKG